MYASDDFYFDSISQIVMDSYSNGGLTLVGDAAYSPGPAVGGGTSLAMVDAYVLPKSSASPAMIMRQGCVPTRTACVNSLQGFAALDLPHDNSYPADAQAGPADADAVSPHHTNAWAHATTLLPTAGNSRTST